METFPDVPGHPLPDAFFCRPAIDSKAWAVATITRDTGVVVAPVRIIVQEHRCWIVDRRVVTMSLYKRDARLAPGADVDADVLRFAQAMAEEPWQPDHAYVLDVSLDAEGLTRVIEVNTLNAAGFYAADIQKLVNAIEEMEFELGSPPNPGRALSRASHSPSSVAAKPDKPPEDRH